MTTSKGLGHLEMWSHFPDASKYFTRTLADQGPMMKLQATSGWRSFVLPFDATGASSPPGLLVINVVLPGRGTVYLGPLELSEETGADAGSVSRLVGYGRRHRRSSRWRRRRAHRRAHLARAGAPVCDRGRHVADCARGGDVLCGPRGVWIAVARLCFLPAAPALWFRDICRAPQPAPGDPDAIRSSSSGRCGPTTSDDGLSLSELTSATTEVVR